VTHENTLRTMAEEPWNTADLRAACLAGAGALRIAREGIARYTENGGCSNCGGVPHTTTCMVGQFAALLATETTR